MLLEKVARDTCLVRREDVEEARGAGVSDEALYDAITVCALFRFYNTWVDGTGVCGMAEEDFRMSGKRIATVGYHAPAPDSGAG